MIFLMRVLVAILFVEVLACSVEAATDPCRNITCPPMMECRVSNSSSENATCVNVKKADKKPSVSPPIVKDMCFNTYGRNCPDGMTCVQYQYNGYPHCQDIDECAAYPPKCDYRFGERCINTWGSYRCTCPSGYEYTDRCEDINECLPNRVGSYCSWRCINTIGSYRCSCPYGYRRLGRFLCRDINECRMHLKVCGQYKCVNTYGGYSCVPFFCFPPYVELRPNRCVCTDWQKCSGFVDKSFRYWTYSLRAGASRRAVTFNYRIRTLRFVNRPVVRYRIESGNDGGEFAFFHNRFTDQVELYNNRPLNASSNYILKFVGEVMDKTDTVISRYIHMIYVFVSAYKF